MKILTICPSRRAKEVVMPMVESCWSKAKLEMDLILVRSGTVTQAINSCLPLVGQYDYIHITNDDVVYRKMGWDALFCVSALVGSPRIYYGDDLSQGKNLCTFPFISREIIEAVGFIQLPQLERYFGDTVWYHLGLHTGCLRYIPDVVIEHLTWLNGKSKELPDQDIYEKDLMSYSKWLVSGEADLLVHKIKGVLNGIR